MLTQDDAQGIARKLNAEFRQGRRHELAVFRYKGKYIAQFGISRGSKPQPHDYVARQLFLSRGQCREFLDCSMTLDDYVEMLRRKGLLGRSEERRVGKECRL